VPLKGNPGGACQEKRVLIDSVASPPKMTFWRLRTIAAFLGDQV